MFKSLLEKSISTFSSLSLSLSHSLSLLELIQRPGKTLCVHSKSRLCNTLPDCADANEYSQVYSTNLSKENVLNCSWQSRILATNLLSSKQFALLIIAIGTKNVILLEVQYENCSRAYLPRFAIFIIFTIVSFKNSPSFATVLSQQADGRLGCWKR